MSASELPPRPRLAAHVLARRHVIAGEERVILHDQRRDQVLQIGAREWAVLEAADGTRDAEGIVVAARREGAHARVAAVRELLATLAEQGMLVAGEDAEIRAADGDGERAREPVRLPATAVGVRAETEEAAAVPRSAEASADAAEGASSEPKRLVPLPGEDLRCNGAGTCCHLYGTVMLFPHEARRIQGLLPQWRVGEVPPERWFTPMRGSEPGPVLTAIARDGACGFLQVDGLCAVHRVGGAAAKPWGCGAFPRIFVDDGVAVHVSAKPECPCVLDPCGGEPEPLVDPTWTDAAALPSTVVVRRLPRALEVVPGCAVSRAAAREWLASVAARSVPVDPAATLWALADEAARGGALPQLEAAWAAAPPDAAAVVPWVTALHERAAMRAREHAAWRSEVDLVRRASTGLATLTLLLRDAEVLAEALTVPPEHPEHESRYWRMGVHGYRWLGRVPLVTRLRDEALRVWLGRSLSAVLDGGGPGDPHVRAPLALVEAMLRAHGLGGYASEVTPAAQNV